MSDGPHKSLPLRPKYKRLAEWAYKPAFAISEVCEATESALMQDARIELNAVVRQLINIVEGDDLFSRQPDLVQHQLQELRDDPAVHPLAASAIECTQMAIQQGLQGRNSVEEGIATALSERLGANARTTEEHYLTERGPGACLTIRNRLDEVNAKMNEDGSFSRMARAILGDRSVTVARAPTVYDGLEDGVSL